METPIFKVPCINIGSRQAGRLRAENVIDTSYNKEEIIGAIKKAMYDATFLEKVRNISNPYGTRGASRQIADILKSFPLDKTVLQKKMTF